MTSVDPDTGQLLFSPSHRDWLQENSVLLNEYLVQNIHEASRNYVRNLFMEENSLIGRLVIQDYMDNVEDTEIVKRKVLSHLTSSGREISTVSGSKGCGKTATCCGIVEDISDLGVGIEPAFIGSPSPGLQDRGWAWHSTLEQMEKNEFSIYDESAIFLSARRSMQEGNVSLLTVFPIMRHLNIRGVMFITQSTRSTDVAVLNWSSTLLCKTYDVAMGISETERASVAEDVLFQLMQPRARYVLHDSTDKDWCFVKTSRWANLLYTPLPGWFDDKLSKSFGQIEDWQTALNIAEAMLDGGSSPSFVQTYLRVRSWNKPLQYWKDLKYELEEIGMINELPQEDVEGLEHLDTAHGDEQMEFYAKLEKETRPKVGYRK